MRELRFDTSGLIIPTSWEELVKLKEFLGTYGGATRTVEDQKRYDAYIDSTPREEVLSQIKKQFGEREILLLKNNYPYSLVLRHLPQVGHYLIWSKRGELQPDEMQKIVDSEFSGKEWFAFETAEGNKSVPEIWHAHVMVNMG